MLEQFLVGLAAGFQTVAAVLAFQLNRRVGWRWSWTLISVGFGVMAVRRFVTLYRLTTADELLRSQGPLSETAAVATCVASVLLCAGVWLIGPLMHAVAQHERHLQGENAALSLSLNLAEADLTLARSIQEHLFPEPEFRFQGLQAAGRCQPMRFAGGDYFDYFRIEDGRVVVVIADVSGHGVGPAMLMAELRAVLRTMAQQATGIVEMVSAGNRLISDGGEMGRFATMFLAVIDSQTGTLSYVCGGHEAWLIGPDGFVESLRADNLPLGIDYSETYVARDVVMESGSTLLLATDGFAETTNAQGQSYGIARTVQRFVDDREQTPSQLIENLFHEVGQYSGSADVTDDLTAVAVRFAAET